MQDGFAWIIEKHEFLRKKIKDPNEETKESYQFKVFEREVLKQAETLVKLNAQKTVGMVEAVFGQKHLDMINRLESDEL